MNNMQKWNPFKELETIQNTWLGLNRMPFYKEADTAAGFFPALDIAEDKEAYHVKMELPDVKKEDIKVEFHDGVLTISGEKKFEKDIKNEDKKYHRIERSYGTFMRSFTLPNMANADQVMAEYANGLLDVKIAKKALAASSSKQITVK